MTTTRLFRGLVCLLVIVEFWGCTDHRLPVVTPGANRLRVKTITQQLTSSASVSIVNAFSYDGQGRLSSIIAYQTPDSVLAPVENTLYQYDGQNRLTQVQHAQIRRGSASESYGLTYNSVGQLSGLSNSPSSFFVSPRYNSDNKVSTYGKSISISGLRSSGGGSFTFTANNLTSANEAFSVSASVGPPSAPPVYSRSINASYTFDNKVNPFYGVFIIPAPGVFLPFASSSPAFGPFYTLYGGIDNPYNLSENNVLSVAGSNGVSPLAITYSYTYNSANLPTSRTTMTNSVVTETLIFTYEAY
ncbi:hypothetical protein [Spirosoma spitsbergense]|jgi:hypothetical protein|uniref:hypothetical protein n=1 Tax=Spirosoma spitsbergense TaxID=431554 RepID=UPI000399AAD7|nr:hypothetical protein [Spirosoma spitsbergense]